MGNGFSASLFCCTRPPRAAGGHHSVVEPWPSDDEALGHSFRYVRPSSPPHSPPDAASPPASPPRRRHRPSGAPAFSAISGAAVAANSSSRPVLRPRAPPHDHWESPAASNTAGFEGSSSFAAAPLQLSSSAAAAASSGPLDRGFFLSGPIERGPLDGLPDCDGDGVPFSAPLGSKNKRTKRRRAFPGSDSVALRRASLFLRRSLSERSRHWVVPVQGRVRRPCVQWAHGKAGEDRAHVVVSEEHRWLFVGIYDGFNGPDAPDFLVANLYRSVLDQLKGLFWEEEEEEEEEGDGEDQEAHDAATGATQLIEDDEAHGQKGEAPFLEDPRIKRPLREFLEGDDPRTASHSVSDRFMFSLSKLRDGFGSSRRETHRMRFPLWRHGEEGKDKATAEVTCHCRRRWTPDPVVEHGLVLRALSRALEITELAYLEMTDREIGRNPELALMGSCLLVVLMRGDDVYVMNVGDSRAIIAMDREISGDGLVLKGDIVEAVGRADEEAWDEEKAPAVELAALQLSTDHSTSIEDEIHRIREEHPDDDKCIINNRVKGRLKVTRAFGAGFLKQPKWNDGLIEMFRNEYIGTAPYISCSPSLIHHKLGQNDQFLVLSSDGLYQYLTNEEVISHVQNFMGKFPDGDPAQSLIEELLLRAARKAGMDFFELLDIPQGDRRKYHDDVTVMVISLEGRMWKSSG